MRDLVIVGTDNYGLATHSVVLAINERKQLWKIRGFVEDDDSTAGSPRALPGPVLGGVHLLETLETWFVMGTKSPATRARLDPRLSQWGRSAASLVHPDATVPKTCPVGEGSLIAAGARVASNATLGRHVHIGANAVVSHGCVIGDYSIVAAGAIVLGDVRVGRGATIAAGAIVVPGFTISDHAQVGAGAVVVRDVPADELVVGSPARAISVDARGADAPDLGIALIGGALRLVEVAADGAVRAVDPYSSDQHRLLYVATAESLALADAIAEFEELLNDPRSRELEFQRFFERRPDFITGHEYSAAHPHVVLSTDDGPNLIPDFVLEPISQGRLCDLLEIKLPTAPVVVGRTGRPRLSAAVAEAHSQLRQYREHLDQTSHRAALRSRYGLDAFRPAMVVLLGRRGSRDSLDFRRAESTNPDLKIITYDDVLERVQWRLEEERQGLTGSERRLP